MERERKGKQAGGRAEKRKRKRRKKKEHPKKRRPDEVEVDAISAPNRVLSPLFSSSTSFLCPFHRCTIPVPFPVPVPIPISTYEIRMSLPASPHSRFPASIRAALHPHRRSIIAGTVLYGVCARVCILHCVDIGSSMWICALRMVYSTYPVR